MTVCAVPWTLDQVASLNAYQASGLLHPFTCGNPECRGEYGDPLFATPAGWVCPHCPWRQFWAHPWMADGSWLHPHSGQIDDLMSSGHARGGVPDVPRGVWQWDADRQWVRLVTARQREERARARWADDVKRRLGLVTTGDPAGQDLSYAGFRVLARPDWTAGCRCVALGGIRLSPGCPVHGRPWSDLEISNCDPGIPVGLEDDLRNGMITHHNGWHFNGHVWYDPAAMLFREEVFRFHVSQGVRSAPDLTGLAAIVNDEFGWA